MRGTARDATHGGRPMGDLNHWGQRVDISAAGSSGAQRLAVRIVQLGAVAVVLAALPFKLFELDRFFVPKELVLHATATLVAALCLAGARRLRWRRVDRWLMVFLVLSALSTGFASNPWLAVRALAITLSGAALFWSARSLAGAGLARPLVNGLAVAVVIGAATSLLQAYGVRTEYFSLNRAPGGTFGNRNFVAHLAAFGLPVVFVAALRARGVLGFLLGMIGIAALAAVLFLTRSRAAWLAVLATAVVLLPFAWRGRRLWRHTGIAVRTAVLVLGIGGGVAVGVVLPNTLRWRSDNPYLETAKGLVNAKEGSGAGRLVQYRNSARIALAHPLLGAGPGNWPVAYPRYAERGDPSMSDEAGVPANPWPSSDWVAYLSERGPAATLLLLAALAALALAAWRALRDADDAGELLGAMALAGTLTAAVVTGLFDAVLLLPAPAFLVWTALGALSPREEPGTRALGGGARSLGVLAVLLVGGAMTLKSAFQAQAMAIANASVRPARLERAARLDPGNYRIRLLLARQYARRGSCRRARPHARAAHRLLPEAAEARQLARRCGADAAE